MLWEGEPLESTAARLEEYGVRSIVFDPCGNRPEAGDFLTVQRANLENLRSLARVGS
jgi:zinc transport system substrate-binding protein